MNNQRHIANFLNRAIRDQTPGAFDSRGADDANLGAMNGAAKKLGFTGVEWYSDCQEHCLGYEPQGGPKCADIIFGKKELAELRASNAAARA